MIKLNVLKNKMVLIIGILVVLIDIIDILWAFNIFGSTPITALESILRMVLGVVITTFFVGILLGKSKYEY